MKKRSKWLKWQIGAGGTIAFAMLLQTVKADPAFEAAQQKAQLDRAMKIGNTSNRDMVMDEWLGSTQRSNHGSMNRHSGPTSDRTKLHQNRQSESFKSHSSTRMS